MGKLRDAFKWAEVKERTDIYTYKGTTEWGNHDLYPIQPEEKQFGYLAYFAYWVTGGTAIFTFTLGSGYIAIGLNAGQTIGACFLGALLSSCIGVFGARPGQDYGIGYVSLLGALIDLLS
jgi:NCS1 family nucleobase:cation symporter-1